MELQQISLKIQGIEKDKQLIYLWEPPDNVVGIFVYFHGLPGAPINYLVEIPELLGSLGFRTITMNYPGLWDETGYFRFEDITASIQSIFDYIHNKLDSKHLYLFGESFGGLIAIQVVSQHLASIQKVVLKSPVTDIRPIAKYLPQTFSYLESVGIMKRRNKLNSSELNQINSIHYLEQTTHVPFWGVIGKNDQVLPAKAMVEAVKSYSHFTLELWNNFPHNGTDLMLMAMFKEKLKIFLFN